MGLIREFLVVGLLVGCSSTTSDDTVVDDPDGVMDTNDDVGFVTDDSGTPYGIETSVSDSGTTMDSMPTSGVDDTDGDGLSDDDEVNLYNTDPNNPDTDFDTLSDGDEINLWGSDPLRADTDGDGLTDAAEVNTHNTDVNNADTDGDLLLDGVEINVHGSDPLLFDTDADGLADGDEVLAHGSSPILVDTDGDGLDDGDEVLVFFTDPASTDTDADGLGDADELNTWLTDPTLSDTDNDGLGDGSELTTHFTDPLDFDTDDDLLIDGDEVNTWFSDPNVPDTDTDGLLDGEEVATWGSDPTLADTDADGLLDGDEALTHGTDPSLADTDNDVLNDFDELFTYGTDPLVFDTDGCGASDGQEVLTDGTDPNSPEGQCDDLEATCPFPSVPVDDPAFVPPADTFDPAWLSIEWFGAGENGSYHDFRVDLNDDDAFTDDEELSATIFFDFYGPERFFVSVVDGTINDDYLCTVSFDLDTATVVAAPTWNNAPADLFEALSIQPGTGATDCPALDVAIYGTDDVRELIANVPIEIALGALDFIDAAGEASFADGVWASDIQPFAYGAWASWDGVDAAPLGYGEIDDAVCGDVLLDAADIPAVASGPLPDGVRLTTDLFYFPVSALTDIVCDRHEEDITVVGWTPPGGMAPMNIGLFTAEIEGSVTPEGEFRDYARDADANFVFDGVIEPYSARIRFQIFGPVPSMVAGPPFLCTVTFDATNTVAVDPEPWDLVDVVDVDLEQYGAFLWAGFETTLADGFSDDCGPIDAGVWGTDNIVELIMTRTGGTLGFGYGPMFLLAANGPIVFTQPTWDFFVDFFQATYVTIDDVTAVESSYSWLVDTDDCATEVAGGFLLPTAFAPAVPAANYEDLLDPWPVVFAGIPEPGFPF